MIKKYTQYLLPVLGFIAVALLYFYPVLQGKEIYQSDIVQYTGMAKETIDYRATYQEEPYWNTHAFGGMPTYQLGAKYPHNYIKEFDHVLRFLPRPADYLFLYLLGIYILLLAVKIKPLQAGLGALLFGFSTYLIIIIGVGHNAKAHAIAYMPWVIAGVYLVFKQKYRVGALLTMLGAALELQANHFQMTYYLLIFLLILSSVFIYQIIKEKKYKHLGICLAIFSVSAILAIGLNATNLMATSEYAQFSTRGKSELTKKADGTPKTTEALSKDYITEYSYGIFETFNLFSPKVMGGASNESLTKDSNTYAFIADFLSKNGYDASQAEQIVKQTPTYWGEQPIVAAPAYIGGIVIALALLALFLKRRKIVIVLAIGTLVSILLSWGKYFPLTNWFIDYFPLYNKFRAVSSIQVIAELCLPVLAVIGITSFFKSEKEMQLKALKKAGVSVMGIFVLLLFGYFMFSFQGTNDSYYGQMFGNQSYGYIEALIADRKSIYLASLLKTFIFIGISGGILYLFTQKKIKQEWAFVSIILLATFDLVSLDLKYVNKEQFVSKKQVEQPFQPTITDSYLKEQPGDFRVFDTQGGFNSARASYFHQAFGGYHAAKPRKVQELMDYQLSKNNLEILNMYNVKYILHPNEQNELVASENPEANGSAWFISTIKKSNSADETMALLNNINTKKEAIVKIDEIQKDKFEVDSLAQVQLVNKLPNKLTYKTSNDKDGFAVFSENYYPYGWEATIDGKPAKIVETNYTLRGLEIPKGNHEVVFEFKPEVVSKGSFISLIFSILSVCFIGFVGFFKLKRNHE